MLTVSSKQLQRSTSHSHLKLETPRKAIAFNSVERTIVSKQKLTELSVVVLHDEWCAVSNAVYVSPETFKSLTNEIRREIKEVDQTYIRIAQFIFRLEVFADLRKGQLGIGFALHNVCSKYIRDKNLVKIFSETPVPVYDEVTVTVKPSTSFESYETHFLDKDTLVDELKKALSKEILSLKHPLFLQLKSGVYEICVQQLLPHNLKGFGVSSLNMKVTFCPSASVKICELEKIEEISAYIFCIRDHNEYRKAKLNSELTENIREKLLNRRWVTQNETFHLPDNISAELISYLSKNQGNKKYLEWSDKININFVSSDAIVVDEEIEYLAKRIFLKFTCHTKDAHQHETNFADIFPWLKETNEWFAKGEKHTFPYGNCKKLTVTIHKIIGKENELDDQPLKVMWDYNDETVFEVVRDVKEE